MKRLKKIYSIAKTVSLVAIIIFIALLATNKGLFTTVVTNEKIVEQKQARITELKQGEQGQKVLQLWAEEQYANEQKAEAEETLEMIRAESLSLE